MSLSLGLMIKRRGLFCHSVEMLILLIAQFFLYIRVQMAPINSKTREYSFIRNLLYLVTLEGVNLQAYAS